ncbi:hypothetical protein GCM10022233_65490 [Streptomyces shaanxiensis]|uniref:Uncharacterized protein n=1 Tax=Streptomyces shaanxiensis TaxID=653357 RepID=A0ABP7W0G7_9ACTN
MTLPPQFPAMSGTEGARNLLWLDRFCQFCAMPLSCALMGKAVRLYWGYIAVAALIVAWSQQWSLSIIVALSVAVSVYASFQVPV